MKPARNGVHRRHLDVEFLQLVGHGLGDGFDGMLGGGVDPGKRIDVESLPGRHPHDATLTALDHLLGDPLGQ